MKELLEKQIERYVVEVKQLRRRTSSSVSAIVADTLEGVIANLRDLVNEIKRTEKAEAKETKANASMSLTDAASKILRGDQIEEGEIRFLSLVQDSKEGFRARVVDSHRNNLLIFLSKEVWKNEDDAEEAAQYWIDEVLPEKGDLTTQNSIWNKFIKKEQVLNKIKTIDAKAGTGFNRAYVESEEEELEEDSDEFEDYEDYKVGTIFNNNPRGYRPTVYDTAGKEVFSTVFVWKDQDEAIEAAKEFVDKNFFERVKDGPEFGLIRYVLDAQKDGKLTHSNEKYLKGLLK